MHKKFAVTIIMLLLSLSVSAQIMIGQSKSHVKHQSEYLTGKYFKTSKFIDTDTSYTVFVRGDVSPFDVYFIFNNKGDCKYQNFKFECDTCCQKQLAVFLKQKRFQWKPIAFNQYLSKFSRSVMLTFKPTENAIEIKRITLDKNQYAALLQKQ